MNPFDEAKAIYTGEATELNHRFMVNKILSYMPEVFLTTAEINKWVYRIPSWAILGVYNACIKHRKSTSYIPYEKAVKLESPVLTNKISTHLCCSTDHAVQTIALLKLEGHKPESLFGLKEGE